MGELKVPPVDCNKSSLDKTLELKQRLRPKANKQNYVSLNRNSVTSSRAKASLAPNTKQVTTKKANIKDINSTNNKKVTKSNSKVIPNSVKLNETPKVVQTTVTNSKDKPESKAASPPRPQVPKPADRNISIYDLAIDGPGSSHDKGGTRFFSHDEWRTMKEGLVNKILEQEIELNQLRDKVSSYETMLMLMNNDRNHPADKAPVPKKPPQPPLQPPIGSSLKIALHDHTCHLIGDSHVRGLARELSSILPRSCRAEGVFVPGVGFHGLANQHAQFPRLVTPSTEDSIVVMCGTNDVCSEDWATIQNALDILISKFKSCKIVCVVGVPLRYDNKKLNYHIKRFNLKLRYYFQSKLFNFHFLDPNRFIKPKDYGKDGIHLNKYGKSKLCKRIRMAIADEKLATMLCPPTPSPPSCENWLLSEPVRDELPIQDNASIIICDDLIDLTDPPQPDTEDQESFFSKVMTNTVLFPDTSVNNYTSNAEAKCQTPYTYSTPCPINSGNRYYQLTQVSLNSFTNNASYCSPLSTTTNQQNLGQQNLGFQNVDQTNSVI
uniref:OSK domain-containing protein n=1 Tax=Cacopsylla melanoneura TaxID=428564 RepID=A0A8D9F3Z2_9HEMI